MKKLLNDYWFVAGFVFFLLLAVVVWVSTPENSAKFMCLLAFITVFARFIQYLYDKLWKKL